ncbi:MAG: transposase [Deltaproteobacteria bacterium]|nr:transposase [Deltaproteobacteria bacterium]
MSAHVLLRRHRDLCPRPRPPEGFEAQSPLGVPRRRWAVYDHAELDEGRARCRFLAERRGWLVADGFAGFDQVFERPEVRAAGCWAHARRYFVEALESGRRRASLALRWMQALFAVERRASDDGLNADDCLALRRSEACR